ncbi:MAG: YcjX family protein [Verrucomicrobiota bacterium]
MRTRVRRIGITGSARSGKTVFLLSLINHLEAGDFPLGGKGTRKFRRLPCKPGLLSRVLASLPGIGEWFTENRNEFDYSALRKHLADRQMWPHKTTNASFFRCRFQRDVPGKGLINLWHPIASLTEDELEFFDFPGERVADVTMIDRGYADWSDMMVSSIIEDPTKKSLANSFIRKIGSDKLCAEAVLSEWKLALGRLHSDCHATITPSTFLVDGAGNTARERVVALRSLKKSGKPVDDISIRKECTALRDEKQTGLMGVSESPEEFAAACCSGSLDKEFAPLSDVARKLSPDLAKLFEGYYDSYQKEVVHPFTAHLLSCHSLIFLVDITDVLGSGVQKLNDTQAMIWKLLECTERGRGFFTALLRKAVNIPFLALGGKWGFIERIAFVASKADKVQIPDRDKLKPLLKDLVGNLPYGPDKDEIAFFPCSAVMSTKPVPNDVCKLVGQPIWSVEEGQIRYRPPGEKEVEVRVPGMPEYWPHEPWKAADYQFVDFHPAIPAIHLKPPNQVGLNEVLEFIIKA